MAEIVLFHHALGVTPGVLSFADTLREAGHTVHVPDAYDGVTFSDTDEGVAHAGAVGFDVVMARSVAATDGLPADVYYLGMSLGVMPAQYLAQTRPGARGAVLLYSAVPLGELGDAWPEGVPLQMHLMADDPFGDLPIARSLADAVPGAELHVYPGETHLFAEESSPDYDPAAAAQLRARVLAFLA
ncbi:MAG TPA: dienelactone hydrolase family protein [Frankiaceae bacterium]|jgi:dienelactone hydrolase|nr:dienelactone hydrolase family protein [Frankiaceae bacterium]